MKKTDLHIKGMVCPRCETVIRQEMAKLQVRVIAIQPGHAIVEVPRLLPQSTIAHQLRVHGFELLEDPNQQLVEQIKNATLAYLRRRESAAVQGQEVETLSNFLAHSLGKSYSQLSKLFSRHEEKTLEHYYIRLRIERVKELLDYGELNVGEIANKLGYSSVHYLSAQFKKVTHQSISDYRKNLRRSYFNEI